MNVHHDRHHYQYQPIDCCRSSDDYDEETRDDASTHAHEQHACARHNFICTVSKRYTDRNTKPDSAAPSKAQNLYVDSCATLHCTGDRDSLQNQTQCDLNAEGFRGAVAHTSIMGDLYVVLMATRPDKALEPRMVLIRDVYYFEHAPRMLLSYPRLSSKGCTLLLSRAKSTLHFPESDGDGFDVNVSNSDGEMPFIMPAYVGSKSEATRVYDEAMRKTHWHLASLAIARNAPTPSSVDTASTSRLDDSVRANCTLPIPGSTLHGRSI